jgi:DNA-binding transcriptional MerR regulator
MSNGQFHTLNEICVLADLPVRTVRYYVQQGLVDRPDGETRAARYGQRHLEQVLLVKKWTTAGVSLERIRQLLQGNDVMLPYPERKPGSVEVRSHLHVAEGVEIVLEPGRAGMSPEKVRKFTRGVMALYAAITPPKDEAEVEAEDNEADKDGSV